MTFVELAAIDNYRYIIYGSDDVALFDHDDIVLINLNTLSKVSPKSDDFGQVLKKISDCLPHMLIRVADPADLEMFEELKQYKFNPTQVVGFDVKKFLNNIFDYTSNESLKRSYENIDKQELRKLSEFFDANIDDVDRMKKALESMDKKSIDNLLDELDISVEDFTAKKVYQIKILDLVLRDSPLKKVVEETFDLSKDDALRKELKPLMEKYLREGYYTSHIGGKQNENLYIFTDPRIKKLNVPWWPQHPATVKDWEKLYKKDEEFKTLINNLKLRPTDQTGYKAARMWEVPMSDLMGEKEITDVIQKNTSKLRGHEMKTGMEPWFKKYMGSDYLDMFVEPGSASDRKIYVFVEPDSNVKVDQPWWPKNPMKNSEYIEVMEKYQGFKDLDSKYYGSGA